MKLALRIAALPLLSFAMFAIGYPVAAAPEAAPLCMTRNTVGAPGGDHAVTVIVREDSAAIYRSRGFAVTPCRNKLRTAIQTRRQICAIAEARNRQIEDDFFHIYLIKPTEYCGQLRGQFGR